MSAKLPITVAESFLSCWGVAISTANPFHVPVPVGLPTISESDVLLNRRKTSTPCTALSPHLLRGASRLPAVHGGLLRPWVRQVVIDALGEAVHEIGLITESFKDLIHPIIQGVPLSHQMSSPASSGVAIPTTVLMESFHLTLGWFLSRS